MSRYRAVVQGSAPFGHHVVVDRNVGSPKGHDIINITDGYSGVVRVALCDVPEVIEALRRVSAQLQSAGSAKPKRRKRPLDKT